MTSEEKLAQMANGIASFFRAYPEEQALTGIRDHIRAFWPARMRQDLASLLGRAESGLDPLVTRALSASAGGARGGEGRA